MRHVTDAPFFLPLPQKGGGRRLREIVAVWKRRSASRTDLARLDARALRDVGLTRFEAEVECAKPFWRA